MPVVGEDVDEQPAAAVQRVADVAPLLGVGGRRVLADHAGASGRHHAPRWPQPLIELGVRPQRLLARAAKAEK